MKSEQVHVYSVPNLKNYNCQGNKVVVGEGRLGECYGQRLFCKSVFCCEEKAS